MVLHAAPVPTGASRRGRAPRDPAPHAHGLPTPRKLDTVVIVDHQPDRSEAAGPDAPAVPGSAGEARPALATTPAGGSRRARRRRRPVRWQRAARLGIAAGLALFAAFLVTGLRERRDSTEARAVDRADPDAVSESAGIEFVRSDGEVVIFRLMAERQSTYANGSMRFSGGVAVTVPPRRGRDGFTMSASELSVEEGQGDFAVSGDVRMADADGLAARTGGARYSEARNVVTMNDPAGPTRLVRAGLEAFGDDVVQDRERGVITLDGGAGVRLTGDADRAAVDVAASHATLADTDRYMRFEGGTSIETGELTIVAETGTAYFGEGENALESMELRGGVRIRSTAASDGGLRESSADETGLEFDPATREPRRVVLAGQSVIELVGADGGDGSRIESDAMDVSMAPGGTEIVGLEAGGDVFLRLPVTSGEPRQEIRARTFTATGTPETGLTGIGLDGGVTYRERHEASADGAAVTRTVRADRFEAGVNRGLVGLLAVRFDGGVRFDDESRRADAARAAYDLLGGTIVLAAEGEPLPEDEPPEGEPPPQGEPSSDGESSSGSGSVRAAEGGQPAILVDGSRTIEARGSLEVALNGSRVSGAGGVQTVLAPPGDGEDETDADRVPALMERTQRINIRADTADYDNDARQVTYGGEVRMWQGNTSFEGETISIDHATGGLSIGGPARTTIQLVRIDEETGENVVSRTDATAGSFVYDDAARHAVYEGGAVLRSDHGDLAAEKIEVFLQPDGRTLDRFVATGAVQLRLAARWATGETLVYHEAEGRYEMEGAPVEIVEEAEPDDESAEAEPAEPSEPVCRSTRGLALTFYRGSDVVAVDGRERSRTETASGPCQPLEF